MNEEKEEISQVENKDRTKLTVSDNGTWENICIWSFIDRWLEYCQKILDLKLLQALLISNI